MHGELIQTLSITQKRKRWEFPHVPFVEFESGDERWARRLGFGREVEVVETITARGIFTESGEGRFVFRCVPTFTIFAFASGSRSVR
jgi:hypothetical protein